MTKIVFISLNGKRTVRSGPDVDAVLVPVPPAVIILDSRPWVRWRRSPDLPDGAKAYVYQEASFSRLDVGGTKVHPRQEDCENAERENANLRAILAWVSATLRRAARNAAAPETMGPDEIADEIASRLRCSTEDGGVTVDSREEERKAVRDLMAAAGRLADLADQAAYSGNTIPAVKAAEAARTVRDKVQELAGILPATIHEARRKE